MPARHDGVEDYHPRWRPASKEEMAARNKASAKRLCLMLGALAAVLAGGTMVRRALRIQRHLSGEEAAPVERDSRHHAAVNARNRIDALKWLASDPALQPLIARKQFRRTTPIDRVPHDSLSFEKFFRDYESAQRPVIIENVPIGGAPWTRDLIRERCGDARVTPVVDNPTKGEEWGNLKKAEATTVRGFLDAIQRGGKGAGLYMHDWAIPKHCPELLRDYAIPKYFVQDYLTQLSVDNSDHGIHSKQYPYKDSWPSLFVGEKATGSGLHVDSGDTHFVMHMVDGVKDFRVLGVADRILAYENRENGTFAADLFAPDFEAHPLLALAHVYTATLRAGDLLFIPGGSGHQVVNQGPVIALSYNFVDASNVKRVITAMEVREYYAEADALQMGVDEGLLRTDMKAAPQVWAERAEEARRRR
eukprot:TRINITY_DN1360_c0_g1_i2.p1 TRINITY_DN1360_c0_g1~~TRINITY_DN1360_c0_g1_i2.p1  ORF type:complete len:419 (+),score=148.25 TRINITY_DN1360_c0_g1_i2:68-1324(+)